MFALIWQIVCSSFADVDGMGLSTTQTFQVCLWDPCGAGNLIQKYHEVSPKVTFATLHYGVSMSLSPCELELPLIRCGWSFLDVLESNPGFHVLWKEKSRLSNT